MYVQLKLEEFGDALLRTQDLDPVYAAMTSANLDPPTLYKLCLGYWCFYHLGVAAKLAEVKQPKRYWDAMMTAALNHGERPDGSKPWPRGAERRHFRGAQAVAAVQELTSRYKTPEEAVLSMLGVRGHTQAQPTFKSVSSSVKRHRGFGPWIAFKVADMSERVLGFDTDFADCELGIYKDPRQGAAVAYLYGFGSGQEWLAWSSQPWNYPLTDDQLRASVAHWTKHWRQKGAKAPPARDRLVNVQEIETIFCKFKSHLKGHYPVGKDSREIHHGLTGWGDLAQQLKQGVPHAAS